jgi:hypothetical protein
MVHVEFGRFRDKPQRRVARDVEMVDLLQIGDADLLRAFHHVGGNRRRSTIGSYPDLLRQTEQAYHLVDDTAVR